ncbi:MAG TPA: DUF4350 domain-containing protein [Sandaracinaceae bacterium]
MRRWATRAVVAACVILGLGAAGLMCRRVGERGRYATAYSTYGAGPDGTRALFLLAEQLGARPRRWAEDLGRLPERGMLVALGSCDQLMRRELGRIERENLARWVERGGVLLVAGIEDYATRAELGVELEGSRGLCLPTAGLVGMLARAEARTEEDEEESPPDPRLEDLPGALVDDPAGTYDEITEQEGLLPAQPAYALGGPAAGLPPVGMRRALSITVDPERTSEVLLELEDGRPAAVRVAVGRGTVIALASASQFTNRDLRSESGGLLFARLVREHAPEGPILFDEYHLGVGQQRSMMRYLRQVGAGAAFVQILLLAGLALWRLGARFGAPRTDPPPLPGGTASYVDGVATLYAKSGDPDGASAIVVRRALARIAQHHHLGTNDPSRMIDLLTSRRRHRAAQAVAVLARMLEPSPSRSLSRSVEEVDGLLARALSDEREAT